MSRNSIILAFSVILIFSLFPQSSFGAIGPFRELKYISLSDTSTEAERRQYVNIRRRGEAEEQAALFCGRGDEESCLGAIQRLIAATRTAYPDSSPTVLRAYLRTSLSFIAARLDVARLTQSGLKVRRQLIVHTFSELFPEESKDPQASPS